MFCTKCGKPVPQGAKFCPHCGAIQTATAAEQEQPSQPVASPAFRASPDTRMPPSSPEKPKPRPWVRFWARQFDIIFSGSLLAIATVYFYPEFLIAPGREMLAGLAFLFAWVFIEPFLLATFGTTPGKWLFNIRLVPPSGDKADFSVAFSRSFDVWWRGLGLGLPLVGLFTMLFAYNNLKNKGQTTWDKNGGFTVVHERLGAFKLMFAVVFFLASYVFIAISFDPSLNPKAVSAITSQTQSSADTQTSESVPDKVSAPARVAAASSHAKLIADRYRDNNDGTVTDTQTGLQWKRCYEGQTFSHGKCFGTLSALSWYSTMEEFSQTSFAGKSDWRVPSNEELYTLVYCSSGRRNGGGVCEGNFQRPTLNTIAFPGEYNFAVWSNSLAAANAEYAWVVNFSSGDKHWSLRYDNNIVRLVRGQ